MKKEAKIVLSVVAAILVIALMSIIMLSQRITMNPAGTVGNTAGNLNNGGLVCEYDGVVYFSNTFEGGSLYKMNPDESGLKRINTLKVQNILAGGKYLYYFQTGATKTTDFSEPFNVRSLERCRLNGSNSTSLIREVVTMAQLVDNYLYLLTSTSSGPRFSKLKIDNSDREELGTFPINPACAVNGTIYYNGTESNHYLYALDTATDTPREVWRGNLWYPILEVDYVYYMDVANNYRLCRYSMSQNMIEILTQDRADCFNVGGGYIYYQKNGADPQLKCMRTDGTDVKVIAQGNYTHINMSSQYVYFQEFGNDSVLYHSRLGTGYFEPFQAAAQAAEE